MVKEINHIGIKSYRMEDTLHFYVDLLGGEVIKNAGSTDGRFRFVYVQIASGVVELITSLEEKDQGFAHVAFLLADKSLDAHHDAVCAQGCTFTLAPKLSSSGDGR
ncbi:MAG TPA: VOC family protein, partial [Clostridia bacterium]|nr:VOC family protein [Clostridia bacterium]